MMKLTKIIFLASLVASSSFNLYAQEKKGNVDLSKFRFSYEEMQQIANPKSLSQ
ncbi:conserved exported hypothetical protein [Enterobacterales bacterium 8AC]|nr:conserved exported hypothetical protein [Enterobacterales bacterium 8AC]